ncbi:HAD family hydrolase [Saccharothrix sp. NRRL B-16314]|uniref:HAD family hydrolase n=1 Tax=Saccharothrix sp. NRRL B-16314 TaxID=1463825 RepID=UPI0009DF91AB|nr:HAD-IA family hydrolase [Saccharothrix sp. NRRL B-16314]
MNTSQAPASDPDVLRRILRNTEVLLLDFDGPICSVFSGIPARYVARQLRDILANEGHIDLPAEIGKTGDPFDHLHYAATLGPEQARYVEAALRAYEIEAVVSAEPTPGAHELMRTWSSIRGKVGIVSNNSEAAVSTYLRLHDLVGVVRLISARTQADPLLLKPDGHLVEQAIRAMGVEPILCTLVGDSISDIQAAKAVGVRSIGYINKKWKWSTLASAAPDALTSSITHLIDFTK